MIVGWMLASAVGLSVLFGMAYYADPKVNISDGVRISYGVLHRLAWSCFVTWLIFVCINGYGGMWNRWCLPKHKYHISNYIIRNYIKFFILSWLGFINRFLSWKMFIPLGRLTYVVYLIHLNYLTVYHSYLRKPYYYTHTTQAEHYFGVLLLVFLLAYAICLTIELPFLNLERLLIRPQPASTVPNCLNFSWKTLIMIRLLLVLLKENPVSWIGCVDNKPRSLPLIHHTEEGN